jgi:hypothetical protein
MGPRVTLRSLKKWRELCLCPESKTFSPYPSHCIDSCPGFLPGLSLRKQKGARMAHYWHIVVPPSFRSVTIRTHVHTRKHRACGAFPLRNPFLPGLELPPPIRYAQQTAGFSALKKIYWHFISTRLWITKPSLKASSYVTVTVTQVRGFKPGRSRRIFQGEKIPSAPSFGREVKPWVPCRWFTACKRSLGVSWKSPSRQN